MENERNLLRDKLSRLEKQELTLIEDLSAKSTGGKVQLCQLASCILEFLLQCFFTLVPYIFQIFTFLLEVSQYLELCHHPADLPTINSRLFGVDFGLWCS